MGERDKPFYVRLENGERVPWFQDPEFKNKLQEDLRETRRKLPLATEKTLKRMIYHKPFLGSIRKEVVGNE